MSTLHLQVIIDGTLSDPTVFKWGVPQGSVIGPLLFTCYTTPIQDIIHANDFSCMMYADDTQLYISVKSGETTLIREKIQTCLQEIRSWMQDNFLFLNDSKMEILHLSSQFKYVKELQPISMNTEWEVWRRLEIMNRGVLTVFHQLSDWCCFWCIMTT